MIEAFRILGEQVVIHLTGGGYTQSVEVSRVVEPTDRLEEMVGTEVEVFPVAKQTVMDERGAFAIRTITLGVGLRRQIVAETDADVLAEQDETLRVSDEIEQRLVGLQGQLDSNNIEATFLGINVDDEREAFFRELMRQYDTYDDEFLLTFTTAMVGD